MFVCKKPHLHGDVCMERRTKGSIWKRRSVNIVSVVSLNLNPASENNLSGLHDNKTTWGSITLEHHDAHKEQNGLAERIISNQNESQRTPPLARHSWYALVTPILVMAVINCFIFLFQGHDKGDDNTNRI